ncbi:cytochrome c oxidase subunit II [Fulvivirga sp. M361]|uniref:cytochrome c oxidase subunit II n=1 Tax=Fulvivirga sp. M361 TaxID=2594266 RepID=UPI00117A4B7E|nr:cytochrome c oxidase subunit II [Fulvivirga sp. M361]TRX48607.1 cytochrome c oxidase subunit II [Fulvivirga sp. M361]
MIQIIGIVGAAFVIAIAYAIFKVLRFVDIIKRPAKSEVPSDNNTSALLLLIFVILFLFGFWWYFFYASPDLLPVSASAHGEETDQLFRIAMGVILIPFTLLNILLFYAAYRFRYKKGTFARFYPHNNKLEVIWTVVPGLVFAVLILMGTNVWSRITTAPPENAEVINIMGYQFAWGVRYPGADDTLGSHDYRLADAVNQFGMDLSDPSSFDDFMPLEIHLPKGKPVLLNIFAKDVIHSVFLPHFRLKMDAVPGMPTRFWFTPKYTTEEMREMVGNPEFNYEMACTEICGTGHFAMRMVVVVDEPEAYEEWKASQLTWLKMNPEYLAKIPENLQEIARIKSGIEQLPAIVAK